MPMLIKEGYVRGDVDTAFELTNAGEEIADRCLLKFDVDEVGIDARV